MKNISQSAINALPLLRPPKFEQKIIAGILDNQEDRLAGEKLLLEKFRMLKQGLRDDLLSGRVRVTNVLDEAAA